MKINELRIGNYLSGDSDFPLAKVTKISNPTITVETTKNINRSTEIPVDKSGDLNISALKLNEEWLLKFGFKDNGGGYYQHSEYNFFLFHNVEGEYFEAYKQVPANDDTGDFKTLQDVHKLQNLYFELFDEELTIKEPQL